MRYFDLYENAQPTNNRSLWFWFQPLTYLYFFSPPFSVLSSPSPFSPSFFHAFFNTKNARAENLMLPTSIEKITYFSAFIFPSFSISLTNIWWTLSFFFRQNSWIFQLNQFLVKWILQQFSSSLFFVRKFGVIFFVGWILLILVWLSLLLSSSSSYKAGMCFDFLNYSFPRKKPDKHF